MTIVFSRLKDLLALDRENFIEAMKQTGSGYGMETAVTLSRLEEDKLYTLTEASRVVFGRLGESRKVYDSLKSKLETSGFLELAEKEVGDSRVRRWKGRIFREFLLESSPRGMARAILGPALFREIQKLDGKYRGNIPKDWLHRLTKTTRPVDLRDALLVLRGEGKHLKSELAEQIRTYAGPELVKAFGRAIGDRVILRKLSKVQEQRLKNRLKWFLRFLIGLGSRKLVRWGLAPAVSVMMFLSLFALFWKETLPPFSGFKNRLAVITCQGESGGDRLVHALNYAFERSGVIHPLSWPQVKRHLLPESECTPDLKRLPDLSETLGVQYILLGEIRETEGGFAFSGYLWQQDRGKRALSGKAFSIYKLAENIGRKCLSIMEFEELAETLVSSRVYSLSSFANHLYAHGDNYLEDGQILGAKAFFETAVRSYDSSFTMAIARLSDTLGHTGELEKARLLVEQALEQEYSLRYPEETLQLYQCLARIYLREYNFEKLETILRQAIPIAEEIGNNEALLKLLKIEARAAETLNKPDLASKLLDRYFDQALALQDPVWQVEAWIEEARQEAKNSHQKGVLLLEQALEFSIDHQLIKQQLDVVFALSRQINESGFLQEKELLLPKLQAVNLQARKHGSSIDQCEGKYWLGRTLAGLGQSAEAEDLLFDVANKAEQLGALSLEVRARQFLALFRLGQGRATGAELALESLLPRLSTLPPLYEYRIRDCSWRIESERKRYEKALEHLKAMRRLTQVLRDEKEEARVLNNLGWVAYLSKEYRNAEQFFLSAKDLKVRISDPSLENTYKNLVLLYEALGDQEKLESIRALLKNE